jgi:hypothetical protein
MFEENLQHCARCETWLSRTRGLEESRERPSITFPGSLSSAFGLLLSHLRSHLLSRFLPPAGKPCEEIRSYTYNTACTEWDVILPAGTRIGILPGLAWNSLSCKRKAPAIVLRNLECTCCFRTANFRIPHGCKWGWLVYAVNA